MFKCKECNQLKDLSYFSKSKKTKSGHANKCKTCESLYRKNYLAKNKEKWKAYHKNKRLARKAWFHKLKSKPCVDCGISYNPYCMDFDHLRDKYKNVSYLVKCNFSKEIILLEIAKCELVCVLCHNIRTCDRLIAKRKNVKYRPFVISNIKLINGRKNVPCYLCGIQRELCNMEFDHINQKSKLFNICQMKSRDREKLLLELSKCKVICSLCHRQKSISSNNKS